MSEKTCPHCGCVIVKGRSSPDHRRFFAMIRAAYDHWPAKHEFQPDSAEHLRAWLTCKAGYRESTIIDLPDGATDGMQRLFVLAIEASVKAADGLGFVRPYNGSVVVFKPRSIAWDTLGQREFAAVRDAISDVIEAETGITVDALLREKAA